MKFMIGLPAWGRPNVLRAHTYYVDTFMRSVLESKGYEVTHLVVGSSDVEGEVIKTFRNVEYYQMENLLSEKNNYIYNEAKRREVDYFLWLGSDDFMPCNLMLFSTDIAKNNGYWSSIKNMYMYDSPSKSMHHFVGYLPAHGLMTHGLGAGRVYTKKLLQWLPKDIFGYGKMHGMDGQLKEFLDSFDVLPEHRLIETNLNSTMLSFKTKQNIWSVDNFDHRMIKKMDFDLRSENFNWLHDSVKVMFDMINPENK